MKGKVGDLLVRNSNNKIEGHEITLTITAVDNKTENCYQVSVVSVVGNIYWGRDHHEWEWVTFGDEYWDLVDGKENSFNKLYLTLKG